MLATGGSAVAAEQKDIEAHFYFPCAPISFLSVLRSCFRPRPIALEFSSQHYTDNSFRILVINQILPATFSDIPHQLLLSRYLLYVHALIIQELID